MKLSVLVHYGAVVKLLAEAGQNMRLSWGLIWAQSRYFKALVVVCCVGCSLLFMLWAGYTEQCHSVAQQGNACLPRLQLVYVRPRQGWASQHFLHALVSAWAQRRHALPPGCNSLPCRMPPAALTEASSSSQGISLLFLYHPSHRTFLGWLWICPEAHRALCKPVR